MNAGRLRHRITIETPTTSLSASGSNAPSWATHATVWADITEFGGMENIVANQVESRATFKARIRYLSTVTTKMRVNDTDKGRIGNIIAIERDRTASEYMFLHCAEATNG